MNIFIVIHGSPWTSRATATALRFAEAAVAAGHRIYRVFFYHDAVCAAASRAMPPQDEVPAGKAWVDFARRQDTELIVCVSAALRRGILDEDEAGQLERQTSLLPEFEISGLGQYVDGVLSADRVVTFGG